MSGDTYRRRSVSANAYQCGCEWKHTESGDTLVECPLHEQATRTAVRKFERERRR